MTGDIEATAKHIMSARQSDAFTQEACEKILRDKLSGGNSEQSRNTVKSEDCSSPAQSSQPKPESWPVIVRRGEGIKRLLGLYIGDDKRPLLREGKKLSASDLERIRDIIARSHAARQPESWQEVKSQCLRTIGFLQGMADGLELIAPDKAERCRAFAQSLNEAIERSHASQPKPDSWPEIARDAAGRFLSWQRSGPRGLSVDEMMERETAELTKSFLSAIERSHAAQPQSALTVLRELRGMISDFKGHGMPGFTDRSAAYLVLCKVDQFLAAQPELKRCPGPRQHGHPLVYESHCDRGEPRNRSL